VGGVAIVGSGSARPRDVDPGALELDTDGALAALGATSAHAAGWGVATRQWLGPPGVAARSGPEELAAEAGARALAAAGLARVDAVHVATSTPRTVSSSLAAKVALRLGQSGLSADVRGGGAGAILAWLEAAALVATGVETALVVAVEVISPYLARGDASASLYGDGAAAVVLARGPSAGGLDVAFAGTERVDGRSFTIPGALPPTADASYTFRAPDRAYTGELRRVRLAAAARLVDAAPPADVSLPYGATREQIGEMEAALGAPAVTTLAETGCLGTAAVLASLDACLRSTSPPTTRSRRSSARATSPLRLRAVAAGGGVVWAAIAWTHARA
jgi:hypothetical protein